MQVRQSFSMSFVGENYLATSELGHSMLNQLEEILILMWKKLGSHIVSINTFTSFSFMCCMASDNTRS